MNDKGFDTRLAFPSLYLKAADLRGQKVTLTIAEARMEDLRSNRGAESKLIVYFEEMKSRGPKQKRFVVNKGNQSTIEAIAGSSMSGDWIGKRITLYPTKCDLAGKTVDCIRVLAETEKETKTDAS